MAKDSESGDMKALTHGVMQRVHGLGFDETIGMDHAMGALDAKIGVSDHSLHAQGKMCPRCGRLFVDDSPVRRTANGEYVHDVC